MSTSLDRPFQEVDLNNPSTTDDTVPNSSETSPQPNFLQRMLAWVSPSKKENTFSGNQWREKRSSFFSFLFNGLEKTTCFLSDTKNKSTQTCRLQNNNFFRWGNSTKSRADTEKEDINNMSSRKVLIGDPSDGENVSERSSVSTESAFSEDLCGSRTSVDSGFDFDF